MTDAKETTSSVSEASRFYGHKERYTYYVISLPFAFAGMAIMSYPYATGGSVPKPIIVIEILSWLLFLCAGHNALRHKRGEMEQTRLRAMNQAQTDNGHAYTSVRADAEIKQEREKRILKAESSEESGRKWMARLMWCALLCWVLARGALVIPALATRLQSSGNGVQDVRVKLDSSP